MKKLAYTPAKKESGYEYPPLGSNITMAQEPTCKYVEIYQHILKNIMTDFQLLRIQYLRVDDIVGQTSALLIRVRLW